MRWIVDEDGDIGLTFWGILTFVKYKSNVLVYWFRRFDNAPKYVRQPRHRRESETVASCEKCWRDSAVARLNRADDEDPYGALLKERGPDGCTPEEQAGPDATECPECGRRTVHQYAKVCMTRGCIGRG